MTKKHLQTNNGDIANNKLWFSNQKYVTIKQQQERNMTRFLLLSLLALMYTNTGMSAPWWEQPTVCRMDTTRCYTSMGAGFDSEIWDTDKKCWGMKWVCPDALVEKTNTATLISYNDIYDTSVVKSDYNIELLSSDGDCFGRRRMNDTGYQVMVDGEYVNVYCNGVLNKADEILENGEIVYGEQPTCETLKNNGYIAVANGKCFGKYYDESKYYVECGDALTPKRIITLNGAQYSATNSSAPRTSTEAAKLFKKMHSISQSQKTQYFKK